MHIQAVPEPTHLPESGPSCSQGQKRDLGFSETGGEPWGARAVGQAGRPSFSMRGPCPVWTLENLRPGPGWALGAPCPAPHTTPNTHLQEEAHLGHTLVLRDEVLEEQVEGLQALLVQHLSPTMTSMIFCQKRVARKLGSLCSMSWLPGDMEADS